MGTYRLKSSGTQFFFNLHAANGERILTSERYTTKGATFGGISSCKENSGNPSRYNNLTSKDGKFYFTLKAANGEVIGTSETYNSEAARLVGIASVMTNGPTSGTSDESGT